MDTIDLQKELEKLKQEFEQLRNFLTVQYKQYGVKLIEIEKKVDSMQSIPGPTAGIMRGNVTKILNQLLSKVNYLENYIAKTMNTANQSRENGG